MHMYLDKTKNKNINQGSQKFTRETDPLSAKSLTDFGNRVEVFAESLDDHEARVGSPELKATKKLTEAGVRALNGLLIENPAILNDKAVKESVNSALANLDPDPNKRRKQPVVNDIKSPMELGLSVDRALHVIDREAESTVYYQSLGKIASGSLDALAAIKNRYDGIVPSQELQGELTGALSDFEVVEFKHEIANSQVT